MINPNGIVVFDFGPHILNSQLVDIFLGFPLTLMYSCIAPHGGEIIPSLASKSMLPKFETTRRGMNEIGRRISNAHPDTIVLASPHNLRLTGRIAVVTAENSSGQLTGSSKKSVFLAARCDKEFAEKILVSSVRERLPVVGANFGTAQGPASNMQMDWGTLVPLWFALKSRNRRVKVVIVTPSREIRIGLNFRFGQLLGRLMKNDRRKRFVFIASADQAHAHSRSGPYGFSRSAEEYDSLVKRSIEENNFRRLLRLNERFVENAKPDSLWQIAILAGVTEEVPSNSQLLSYQVPTYYGMACASFEPIVKVQN